MRSLMSALLEIDGIGLLLYRMERHEQQLLTAAVLHIHLPGSADSAEVCRSDRWRRCGRTSGVESRVQDRSAQQRNRARMQLVDGLRSEALRQAQVEAVAATPRALDGGERPGPRLGAQRAPIHCDLRRVAQPAGDTQINRECVR